MKKIGIYVHIPFCKSKCAYCDFTSFANEDYKEEEYIKALDQEINERLKNDEYRVSTIYFGGGTPSFIKEKYIEQVLDTIRENCIIETDCEITLEANPGTITEGKLNKYIDSGINRLSIGLQTSNNNLLKTIGRIHRYKDFETAIELAKRTGFNNINSDIIIGLPGQTIYDVEETLEKITEMNLQHISVYSLILEEGTILNDRVERGEIELPDEEIERYMYWFAKRKLEEAGYIHYEISNFAKPGFYSQHNLDCWSQKEYLGFGISASSYENGIRYSNKKNLDNYIKNIENGQFSRIRIIEEKQNEEMKMNEFMMLGFRKIVGVNIEEFKEKFGKNPLIIYKEKIARLLLQQLIEYNSEYLRLSKKGIDLANIVFKEFI